MKIRPLVAIALLSVVQLYPSASAATPSWDFNPRTAGAALLEGGWMVRRPLAQVNASADFSFPLQLVYLTVRTQRGDFGDQWFCPQLESRLLPAERGVLAWTMLNGGVVGLFAKANKPNQLTDQQGEWQAKITGALTTVANAEGWVYSTALAA